MSSSVKALEEMKTQWDQFGARFETFSLWISEKEKQLDELKSSTLPLEQQINTVKVLSFIKLQRFSLSCVHSMSTNTGQCC